MSKNVKAIVVACNTASAFSIEKVQEAFDIPVIGVISPGANAAVRATRSGRIGIIGTEGTIGSRAYERAIKKNYKDANIVAQPCPLFVPLVEEGWFSNKVSYLVAEEYLAMLKKKKIDTLVMGCTHYPLLKGVVGDIMGKEVTLINPAEETALALKEVLIEKGLGNIEGRTASYKYFVSDNPDKFSRVGSIFLDSQISNSIEKIDIERY